MTPRDLPDFQPGDPAYGKILPLLLAADSGYGLFTTDPLGKISSWNKAAEAIFGWSREEIVGRGSDITFIPEDVVAGEARRELDLAARDGIAPDIRWHQRKDGGRVFINGSVHPLFDGAGELTGFLKIGRDLTGQKQAEAALVEAREKYRALFANIDEGFVFGQMVGTPETVLDLRLEAVNNAFERLSGCAPGSLRGKTAREAFPQMERVWFEKMAEAGLRGRAGDIEICSKAFGCWVSAHFSPFGVEGEGGVAIALREITERKARESDLGFLTQVAQDLLGLGDDPDDWGLFCRAIAQYLDVGYCGLWEMGEGSTSGGLFCHWKHAESGVDGAGLLLLLDPRIEESAPESLKVDDGELLHASQRKLMRSAGARSCLLTASVSLSRELVLLLADSRSRAWKESDVEMARALLARLSLGLEGARATEALRRSEQRHRLMVENVHDYALLCLDSRGVVTGWSSGLQALTGYTEAETVGQHFRLFYTREERDANKPEADLRQADSEGWVEGEGWRRRKDGTRYWVNHVLSPLRDSRGKLLGFVQISRDLTQQRLDEREHLERERETALLAERARLAQELHDSLAQGFVGIKLQVEMATSALQKAPLDLEKALRHLDRARDFAIASQVEARNALRGLRSPIVTNLPLGEALESMVARAEGESSISFQAAGQPVHLSSGVQHDLYRIAQEALTNAIRHSQASEISVTLQQRRRRVVITIADDGRGFDPESLDEGFGLTGIRERAQRLRARLVVESAPNQGTTVEVTLALP